MVATMCFPSFLPSRPAMTGTNVANDPSMYANEHFSIPMPVSDFQNAYACQNRWTHISLHHSIRPNSSCLVGSNWPGASRNSEDSVGRWEDLRSVNDFLTRSPVLGCIIVADRSCRVVLASGELDALTATTYAGPQKAALRWGLRYFAHREYLRCDQINECIRHHE
jgi:hypothetical protein